MELTTGKLKTEPSPIQGTITHIYREKTDGAYIQGENTIPHIYREKSKRPLIQRKASIPIEWKK